METKKLSIQKIKEESVWALLLIPAALLIAGFYWLALPSIYGKGFYWMVAFVLLLVGGIEALATWEADSRTASVISFGQLIAGAVIAVVLICINVGSSAIFNADVYANSAVIVEGNAIEDLPSFEEVEKVSLMDTDSAKKLGDRTMGSLADYVSQYRVSESYTTISYKGRVVKVSPLAHNGFFKAKNNETIPGYVIVDALTNEAKFVEVEGGMTYSPSAFFKKDLVRHIRSEYKKEKLGSYSNFQLDENGVPYFVVAVNEYTVGVGCIVPVGAIVVNAVTGEMQKYALAELPSWVEQVVDGDTVAMMYNRYGQYLNGFWNLADTGKTQVTDDYGYVEKDGDIYIYTGVTSVAADESNIGFIMANTRTGEMSYYPVAGAEEYSSMSAAEGVVQNFGYKASFPSLIMYGDEPTYVMVLKDANGLVKMYAMVNMKNYTIVAVEETLQDCQKAYVKAMTTAGSAANVEIEGIETVKETVIVSSVEFISVEGETIVYVKTEDGRVFKQAFAENENLILIDADEEVEVEYVELETITTATINIK